MIDNVKALLSQFLVRKKFRATNYLSFMFLSAVASEVV